MKVDGRDGRDPQNREKNAPGGRFTCMRWVRSVLFLAQKLVPKRFGLDNGHCAYKIISIVVYLNTGLDVQSMLLNVLFTINTVFLTYNFVKAWKTDPGFIVTEREQKMQVINSEVILLRLTFR